MFQSMLPRLDIYQMVELVLVSTWALYSLRSLLASRAKARRERALKAKGPGEGAPAILAIGTENPPYCFSNDYYMEILGLCLRGKGIVSERWIDFFLPRCQNSGIDQRYCVHPHEDFEDKNLSKPKSERMGLFPSAELDYNPTAEERQALWATWAPRLGIAAANKAVEQWGGDKQEITHLIFHSCTGFKAPGVELDILDALGLQNVRRRFGINYMGCFGAFTGLAAAKSIVEAEPDAIVLLVCVEICSIHFSLSSNRSEFIGNTVFADGGAAAIVGAGSHGDWALGTNYSHLLGKSTRSHMTWAPSNFGYCMYLDKSISTSLGFCLFRNVKKFMRRYAGRGRGQVVPRGTIGGLVRVVCDADG